MNCSRLTRQKRIFYVIIWLTCSSIAILILQQFPFAAKYEIIQSSTSERPKGTSAPTEAKKDIFLQISEMAMMMDTAEVPVLMTFLTNDSLDFANNWLCNVADYGLYQNVVMLTSSDVMKRELTRKWSSIHVFSIEIEMSPYKDREKHLRCNKYLAKAVLAVLKAGLKVLLFRVESVWLQDPIVLLESIISNRKEVNMVIATFSKRSSDLDIGFSFLKAVPEVIRLWSQYIVMIDEILKRLVRPDIHTVSESENERNYFSQLVRQRFGRVKHHMLATDLVADDRWYGAPHFRNEDMQYNLQRKLHVVRNYWADMEDLNVPRKQMMKDARHWFIEEASDWVCDINKVVQAEKSVWRL